MKPEDEQRLQNRDVKNVTIMAGDYFERIFLAKDRNAEIEAVKEELQKLGEHTTMTGISNAVWATIHEALENLSPEKSLDNLEAPVDGSDTVE